MKWLLIAFLFSPCVLLAQDTSNIETLSKETVLSEVVIRNHLDVNSFLRRVKEDTTFYKAFRNLHILNFTSVNDIRMLDANRNEIATLKSRTRQTRHEGCRTMETLEEKATGDMYRNNKFNYYTPQLYASLFFTTGKVCGETNIVSGVERNVKSSSGIEKHKEQLKMLFFNPGKHIPGIPFIGDRTDIFDPSISQYYDFSIDMDDVNGEPCYLFKIVPRADLKAGERDKILFDNITTWFNAKTMEIVARNYDLSFNTPVYDFDVHIEVLLRRLGDLLVPETLMYNGNWKVAFKKRERAVFKANLLYE